MGAWFGMPRLAMIVSIWMIRLSMASAIWGRYGVLKMTWSG